MPTRQRAILWYVAYSLACVMLLAANAVAGTWMNLVANAFGGNPEWGGIVATSDGGGLIYGDLGSGHGLLRVDTSGTPLWAKTYSVSAGKVWEAPGPGQYIISNAEGTWLASLDSSGNIIAQLSFAPGGMITAYGKHAYVVTSQNDGQIGVIQIYIPTMTVTNSKLYLVPVEYQPILNNYTMQFVASDNSGDLILLAYGSDTGQNAYTKGVLFELPVDLSSASWTGFDFPSTINRNGNIYRIKAVSTANGWDVYAAGWISNWTPTRFEASWVSIFSHDMRKKRTSLTKSVFFGNGPSTGDWCGDITVNATGSLAKWTAVCTSEYGSPFGNSQTFLISEKASGQGYFMNQYLLMGDARSKSTLADAAPDGGVLSLSGSYNLPESWVGLLMKTDADGSIKSNDGRGNEFDYPFIRPLALSVNQQSLTISQTVNTTSSTPYTYTQGTPSITGTDVQLPQLKRLAN